MPRRPTSALLLVTLVSQLLGPSLPAFAAQEVGPQSVGQVPTTFHTTKELPSMEARLGVRSHEERDAEFVPIDPADETRPLQDDGTYTLGKNKDLNPDSSGHVRETEQPYGAAQREVHGKQSRDAGDVTMLRTDVGGNITTNTTWDLAGSPYVVTGSVVVQSPAVLTIEPGVIVKLGDNADLYAYYGATILASGTASDPIIITSLKDDSIGGDTNEDGDSTSPARQDWGIFGSLGVLNGSVVTASYGTYQHMQIRYGDTFTGKFSLLTMNDLTIEQMFDGLYLEKNPSTVRSFERLTMRANYRHLNLFGVPSAITIKDSVLTEATTWAVSAAAATAVRLTNNRIDLNDTGTNYAISASSSPMVLRYNSIAWNGDPADGFVYGVNSSGSTVDAQYNWWGSTTGAHLKDSTNTGGGSQVTSAVTHTNWLGKAFEAEHKKGNMPWAAKAGVGVDVATGNLVYTETDINIATVGFPLAVSRTYNSLSQSTVTGDFGGGWTWNYGVSIDTTTDTYGVVLQTADGAKHYFKRNPDGTFSGEYGIFDLLTYDSQASEYTLLHPNQDREIFDGTGKLVRQIDPDGNTTTLARDGAGHLTTVTEPTGRTLTFTYSGAYIATITDPLGRVYRYTNSGYLTKLEKEQPAGTVFATCSYIYGTGITKVTGCNGDTLEQTYHATTKKVLTQKLNGAEIRFAYGPVTDTISGVTIPQYSTGVWDTFGKLHVYTYTKSNAVVMHDREKQHDNGYEFYPEDRWSYYTFVSSSHTDIMGRQVSTLRDWRRGTVLSRTNHSLDRTDTFTYDAFNNPLTATDNLGRVTTNSYDSEQHLVSTTNALDQETTTAYTAAGLVESVTDANDATSTFTYDAYGYPETVTTATNETVTFDYDVVGRKLWEETPDHERTTYTYNGRDQVLTVTDPLDHVTETTYDAKGRKTVVKDAANFETAFAYDDTKNALATTTDARDSVVTFTYNGNGTLQKLRDANGHDTLFTYDAFGRQNSVKDPLNRTSSTVFYADGSVDTTTDARGNVTTATYDAGGQRTRTTYQDATFVTYAYDDVGNRTEMVDADGTLAVTYDDLNRPTAQTRTSATGTETITYGYDDVGNLTTLGYPGGFSVTYAYDDARRIATITDSSSRVTDYDYDANGRIATVALPNGTSATYAYDDAGRITTLTHKLGATPFATIANTYDARNNRLTRAVDGGTAETYAYDELARITEATYPSGRTIGYAYDATGNRTTLTDPLGTVTSSFDAADQLTSMGEGLRQYDADGQLTQIGASRGLTWNGRGQLTAITTAPTNSAPTAHAGNDDSGNVDWLMFLDGSQSSDPEGVALMYAWTEVAGNPATGVLSGLFAAKPALKASVAGTYQFDLTVSDGVNTSSSDRVVVTIASGPPAPITQTVVPASGMSGYVRSANPTSKYFTAAYLMTGLVSGITHLGAAQFTLPAPPAQATLTGATLTMTGYSNGSGNTATDEWSTQILPTDVDAGWASTNYTIIAGAAPDRTLSPVLVGTGQVVANQPNTWAFTAEDLAVLEDRIAGSQRLSIRTRGDNLGSSSRVYWYSGSTSVVAKKPTLTLSYTPDPLPDQAPVADAGRGQTLDTPGTVTLDGRGSFDAEGAVTLAWSAAAENPAVITFADASVAQPEITITTPGTYRFDLAVTDSESVTRTASTRVVVRSAALPAAASFTYDGDGERLTSTVDGTTTRFVVDSSVALSRVVAERTLPSGSWTYHIYGHDLLYSVTGSDITVLHSDPLGSTVATTDSTGAVTAHMSYDIFGERLDTDSSPTAYTFTGERMDPTEFQYLRARFYEPSTGRFLSRDPYPAAAADTQTFDRYVYVKNNPTNYVDPSGQTAAVLPAPTILELLLTTIVSAAPEAAAAVAAAIAPVVVVTAAVAVGVALFPTSANEAEEVGPTGPAAQSGPTLPNGQTPDHIGNALKNIGYTASSHLLRETLTKPDRLFTAEQMVDTLLNGALYRDLSDPSVLIKVHNGLSVWYNQFTNVVISGRYGPLSPSWELIP